VSTQVEVLIPTLDERLFGEEVEKQTDIAEPARAWDPDRFADEQLRSLVRRVFTAGWPRPARQVVLHPVAQKTEIEDLSLRIARTLAHQVRASICVVETSPLCAQTDTTFGRTLADPPSPPEKSDAARQSSRQIEEQVWQLPLQAFLGEQSDRWSAAWLRGRLAQLRRDFDYTLLLAPAAELSDAGALLGQLSDGVILVLQAQRTHRLAARKVRSDLQAAQAKLLGAILMERTFPVPESLYRRL